MERQHAREHPFAAERQIETATWGVFFLWMGAALLAGLGWGVWLIGVGAITLGAQLVHRILHLRVEGLWIAAGVLFVLGGLAAIVPRSFDIPLIPIACIVAGIGLLVRAMIRRPGTTG